MANESDKLSHAILPIPDREHVGLTTYDAKDPATKFPAIEPLRPPKGAPNVLIVLLDDVGFTASSTLGGAINTPTAELPASDKVIPTGQHQLRMAFKYDGGGLAKGGNAALFLDGTKVGEGRVEMTMPTAFSADETCDVGRGTGSAVSPDYGATDNEFSGEVNWVQIDLEKDDHDHLISPQERYKVAMARQ